MHEQRMAGASRPLPALHRSRDRLCMIGHSDWSKAQSMARNSLWSSELVGEVMDCLVNFVFHRCAGMARPVVRRATNRFDGGAGRDSARQANLVVQRKRENARVLSHRPYAF